MSLIFLKLRTEAYTFSLNLLTDSLTHSSVRIMLLETWLAKVEKIYSGQTLTRFQAASNYANLDHVYFKGDMGI